MAGLEACHTVEEFIAVSFEHQCGPAGRLAGELTNGLSLHHAGKLLANGMKGDDVPIVRWLKYMYANSRPLMDLCARGATEPTFGTLSHALLSANADVVLWGARLLTRLATELSELHPQPLMGWLDTQGLAALVSAWRTHPDLHAIGALLPLVPPCVGLERLVFFSSTMPAVLGTRSAVPQCSMPTILHIRSISISTGFGTIDDTWPAAWASHCTNSEYRLAARLSESHHHAPLSAQGSSGRTSPSYLRCCP
jgi:hypothetical protein